jgi:hypothetical protein
LCSPSRTSQHFMEPKSSIPCSQEPSIFVIELQRFLHSRNSKVTAQLLQLRHVSDTIFGQRQFSTLNFLSPVPPPLANVYSSGRSCCLQYRFVLRDLNKYCKLCKSLSWCSGGHALFVFCKFYPKTCKSALK